MKMPSDDNDMPSEKQLWHQIKDVLSKRTGRYSGEFYEMATISNDLKTSIRHHVFERDTKLEADQWEALDLICHKIGWIIQCNPKCEDAWGDISDYAMLVADRLRRDAKTESNVIPLKPKQ